MPASTSTYLGFDRNIYPGDDTLPVLRKTFAFSGFWLGPPPGEKVNTWQGKHQLMQSLGFGFAALYRARKPNEVKRDAQAREKGSLDARNAAAAAKTEGFAAHTIIFLDIEDGGRLSPTFHTYLRAWADELTRAGYRPGVYCSGIPAPEGPGITILTADDIRNHIGDRELVYWIYKDVCPPLRLDVRPQTRRRPSLLEEFRTQPFISSCNRRDARSTPRSALPLTLPTEIATRQATRRMHGFST